MSNKLDPEFKKYCSMCYNVYKGAVEKMKHMLVLFEGKQNAKTNSFIAERLQSVR